MIPNRIVFPPWALKYSDENGKPLEKMTSFYSNLADGGCGLIVVGAALISKSTINAGYEKILRLTDDSYISDLEKIFKKLKQKGAATALQIAHAGSQAAFPAPGFNEIFSPSAVPIPYLQSISPAYKLKEMSKSEIDEIKNDFIDGAIRGYKAGADIVEVHAGHGYLLSEFLSPHYNKRKDEYGGSTENRARFLIEIIKGIREKTSPDNIIAVRISAKEFIEDGLDIEDYKTILPLLESAGVDLLNVSIGTVIDSQERNIPTKFGEAPHVDIIAELKKITKLPIVTVGSILSINTANEIIKEDKADFVAMGRTQMADPQIVIKSANHNESEILKCIQCNYCLTSFLTEPEVCCKVNPDYKK